MPSRMSCWAFSCSNLQTEFSARIHASAAAQPEQRRIVHCTLFRFGEDDKIKVKRVATKTTKTTKKSKNKQFLLRGFS
jgi:hypothetical protein